ncbi:MAG: Flp family type IVb pilin [Magnetovibrio sp.]|nr:Flp family type IVb pilin [Magnetovibrio sp.]
MNVLYRHLKKRFESFGTCDLGATAIEYALIAGLISIVILGGVVSLSGGLSSLFNAVSNAIN